jgi:hypothetical protein
MSRRPIVLFALLVAAVLLPERGWAQGWTQFASPDGSFRVSVPAPPTAEQPSTEQGVKTQAWTLRTDYGGYVFAYSDYPSIPDANAELQSSMKNFASEMSAKIVTQRPFTFKAARGDMLPALDFTYASDAAGGAGRIVVDGNRAYMWTIVIGKGHDRQEDTGRFMGSIAITAAVPAR